MILLQAVRGFHPAPDTRTFAIGDGQPHEQQLPTPKRTSRSAVSTTAYHPSEIKRDSSGVAILDSWSKTLSYEEQNAPIRAAELI